MQTSVGTNGDWIEFNLGEHRYLMLEAYDGELTVTVSEGPDERDAYQRDVRGYREVTFSGEDAPDVLVGIQSWIESLP